MIRNYFFLNRFIVEASSLLTGSTLTGAYSQEKDKLVIEFSDGRQTYFIEISANPGRPYILLKNSFHRARRNTLSFFNEMEGRTVEGLMISENDRLIKISFNEADLFFAIRGRFTNVFSGNENGISEVFKKTDDQYKLVLHNEIKNHKFISKINFPAELRNETSLNINEARKKYPHFGKEVFTEAESRSLSGQPFNENLHEAVRKAIEDNPVICINSMTSEVHLIPEGFINIHADEKIITESVIESFNLFINKKYYYEEVNRKIRITEKHLTRELTRLSAKLNNLKFQIGKGSREDEFNKTGNLLLINLNIISRGLNEIELEDIYDDKKIVVKLDPEMSPEQNASRYFEKARNDRIRMEKSNELFSQTEKKYQRMISYKERIESKPSIKELNEIMKELKIKTGSAENSRDNSEEKFKHYIIAGKYHIYVGKDSKNNDLLTTKFAKQNDLWFHARSVSGSHVVLRIDNLKEPVPKDIIKKTASLAAFHSKAKTAGVVPVSYCFKKYVIKKKGMPAGKVALLKEETVLVRPEIPPECEFVTREQS